MATFLFQYSLSYFVTGFILLFLSAFVLFKSPKNPINYSFSFYSFCVAWWSLFSILMINAPTEFWGTFWDRICLMGVVFIPAAFINFNFTFIEIKSRYANFISFAFALSGLFFLSNFTPYLFNGTSPKFGLNFYTNAGILYLPFVTFFFIMSAIGIVAFYIALTRGKKEKRTPVALLFFSTLIGYSLGGFNYNLSFGIGPPILALIGNYGVAIYAMIVAYAITKHHLMDISVVISRTVAEFLTVFIHGIVYLVFVWFYYNSISNFIEPTFIAITVLFGIIISQTHHPLRLFFQTTTDKVFLHGKYDYYKALSAASSHVVEKLSLPDILSVLYKTFIEIVEISNPRIYLPEYFSEPGKTSQSYLPYLKGERLPQRTGQEIKVDSALISELIKKRGPMHDFKELDAALIVPCLLEDRLIALFVLGQKLSQDSYTEDDIQLLQVLASQVAVALDHTRSYEKISADLETTERQLERSQRLASIGTLTAGVTHEIRNPLTAIRAETERLTTQPRDAEFLKNFQDLAIRNIARIEKIVDRMLGLARQKDKQHISINLNEQLEAILPFIPTHNITITRELNNLPAIQGDPEQLQEVFINIIQNAVQVMPNGGAINIKTMGEKDNVIIEITDNGPGIAPEIQEKIFDPFFSTRHEGTGLGLSIAYRIIREHGGDIKVISQVGKGTTFRITF